MSEPALAPRNAYHGVIAVWIISLLTAVALGIFLSEADRMTWLLISFGFIVLLSFAVQLGYAQVHGFIVRVSASVIGALAIMGMISAGFALSSLASAF